MYEQGPLGRALARLRYAARPKLIIDPPPNHVIMDRDVEVAMRDGVLLRVNVFRPVADGAYPVLMSAHPYGKDRLPKPKRRGGYQPFPQLRMVPQSHPYRVSAWTSWEAPDPGYWVPRGYVVINADLRGWGTSDGIGTLFDAVREGEDYHDLIEWAARQPWSSGKVGLSGVSYLAITQWSVAATRPPHLAAICPWEGLTDLYRDHARRGGVREDGFTVMWSRIQSRLARKGTAVDLRKQQRARPEFDAWWAKRNADIESIDVPALICGSFSDHSLHSRGSFEGFRRIGSEQKWLYTHRAPKWVAYYSDECLATQARFFDHFLTGVDNGQADQPAVRLEVREDTDTVSSVRHESQWPPAGTSWQRWHLDPRTRGFATVAPEKSTVASFATRTGKLLFTHRFTEDTEITGSMLLRIAIECGDCRDVHLFAGIRKLRGGRPVAFEGSYGLRNSLVTFGMRKASHRRTDPARSVPWLPFHPDDLSEPLRLGEVVEVDIDMPPSATLFRAAEELQLDIRGRWFYPRNPLTGQFPAYYEKSARGQCVLHAGPGKDAYLEVPIQPIGLD